jgi:hypothetical protein
MEAVRERMILHQDFMRPYLRSAIVHERDEANDILETARRITFATVWTPPAQLVKQITDAAIAPAIARGKTPKRHLAIRELYQSPGRVIEHYERWFAFAERKSRDHVVVSPHDGAALMSVDEWRRLVADSCLVH